jgi:hypothetical protein
MRPKAGRDAAQAPFILTAKDETMLRMLAQLGVARAFDLAAFVGSPGCLTSVRSRASALAGSADHQPGCVLYRFPFPAVSGNQDRVFCLGAIGRAIVREELSLPLPTSFFRPSKQRVVTMGFLRHALLLTRVVSLAHAFVRRSSAVRLPNCRIHYELARRKPPLPVIPDAFLLFETEGKRYPIWLECDTGSEFQVKWKHYLRRRLSFIRSGAYAQAFGMKGVVLAYVTTGQTRLSALLRWSQEVITQEIPKEQQERLRGIFRFTSLGSGGDTLRTVKRDVAAHGIRPPDPHTLKVARNMLREISKNPQATRNPEDVRRAEAIVAQQTSFAQAARTRARQQRVEEVRNELFLFEKPWYRPPAEPIPLFPS